MKLKPDGTLDTNDSYTSDWKGVTKGDSKETKLGGDGRKVIGVIEYRGAVLDGLALVMDSAKK